MALPLLLTAKQEAVLKKTTKTATAGWKSGSLKQS
jgi:hypothetical protein